MTETEKAFSSLRFIGRGGFGKVYSGYNNLDRNNYAIKEIVIGKDFDKERALREVQIHSKLCHVNIVRFQWTWISPHDISGISREWEIANDHGEYRDTGQQQYLYIAMELCRNNLHNELKLMSKATTLDFRSMTSHWLWMAEILQSLSEGLKYLHGGGFLHRDLKPENVLLGPDGVPKIGDFGLAKLITDVEHSSLDVEHHESEHTLGVGTKPYMSPEQKLRLPYNYKADIFSLGLIFFRMFNPRENRLEELAKVSNGMFEERIGTESMNVLFKKMVAQVPGDRPDAEELVITFKRITEELKNLIASEESCSSRVETN